MNIRKFPRNRNSAWRGMVALLLLGGVASVFNGLLPAQRAPAPGRSLAPGRAPAAGVERTQNGPISIPDLSKKSLADGDIILTSQGLNLGTIRNISSDTSEIDLILNQSPAPDAKAPAGSSVDVQIGIAMVTVPRLIGLSIAEVQRTLRAAHLDTGRITTVNFPGARAPGQVISSEPAEGETTQSHRKVQLLIQEGTVAVPDLSGQTLIGAQSLLATSNLALGTVTGQPFQVDNVAGAPLRASAAVNTVLDWSSKGMVVPMGTSVNVTFPGGTTLVRDRIINSLSSSEIIKAASKMRPTTVPPTTVPPAAVPPTGKQYPSIDRFTSIEQLTNIEPPANIESPTRVRALTKTMMSMVILPPIYDPGIKATEKFEGWEPHLYNDSAKYCTVGYGHLIKRAPCDGSEPYQEGLTPAQGTTLLEQDMYSAHYTVVKAVTATMTKGQVAALTDFVFNVGSANFRTSTLLKVVNANQQDQAPAQFRRWVTAGGKRWPGLVTRREGEITLFFDGMQTTMALRKKTMRPEAELPPVDLLKGEGR